MVSDLDLTCDVIIEGTYKPKEEEKKDLESEHLKNRIVAKKDDCVICMTELKFEADGEEVVEGPMRKRAKGYFETPCNHRYHPLCLNRWIRNKMTCPTCRQELP
jgi:hypothetical protein